MADPLSVAASVAGLLTAAKEVSSVIDKITKSRKSGPKEMSAIKSTVDTLRSVLLQLQLLLLSRASINQERASLILVNEIVVTLTACVMTFSDLDGCMKGLEKGLEADQKLGLLDSVRWASKDTELKAYLRHLEAHKSSLALMMSILTCQSTHNAEQDASELKILMVRVLESNDSLAHRMSTMENSMAMSTIIHKDQESTSALSQESMRDLLDATPLLTASQESSQYALITNAFEEDLQKSRVYQRSLNQPNRFSNTSSVQISLSWSMLSGLSLSCISNIGVQALPIFEKDLQNGDIYNFGDVRSNHSQEGSTNSNQNTLANHSQSFNVELSRQKQNRVNYDSSRTAARPMARYVHESAPLSQPFVDAVPQRVVGTSSKRPPVAKRPKPELPRSKEETIQLVYEILSKNKDDRLPPGAKKQVQKETISTPKLLFSGYKFDTVDNTAPLRLSKSNTVMEQTDESVRQYSGRKTDAKDSYELSRPPFHSSASLAVELKIEKPHPSDFEDVKEEIKSLLDEIRQPYVVRPESDGDPL